MTTISSMRRVAVALATFALLVAGCGGASTSGSATGTSGGAEIAPADALAFVSVDTDRDSGQWKQADTLLKKFPGRDQLLRSLNDSSSGVDPSDVLPLLGKEVDIVVLDAQSGPPHVVAMTQPTDEQKFDALLAKTNPPSVHERVGDWTVFSNTQEDLTAFTNASSGDKLADDGRFKDAMGELPGDANAKAYVNGDRALAAVKAAMPQLGQVTTGNTEWLSLAISSQDDGWKLDGAAKSSQSANAESFAPTLLDKVPAGSLVVASFKGGDRALKQLESSPSFGQLSQLEALIGVKLSDIEDLLAGEGVLYVQKGSPFPEVTVRVKQQDAAKARSVLDQLAARASAFLNGRLTQQGSIEKLSLGTVALYFGVDGGDLVVSDSTAPFGSTVSQSIEDDPMFGDAKDAAGLPDQSSGFVYVNIKDSVPVVEGFAQADGQDVPPNVSQNLAPLQSFLAYTTASGDLQKFSGLLLVR